MNTTKQVPFLDLKRQHSVLAPQLEEAFHRVIGASKFILGEEVELFENEWANSLNVKYCVGCSNGTDAIVLALRALGVGAGDEVITVSHTYIATVQAIVAVGATPVLAEIKSSDGLMDLLQIESKINSRTKCIIPVHLYGQTVDMQPLLELCRKQGIFCIEDSAQAHGAMYHGRSAGSFGDLATFSFYPGKNLGALGDAGAVVTSDSTLVARLRSLRDHGRNSHTSHREFSGNMRLDAIQAAWLRVKMGSLASWVSQRQEIAARYRKRLARLPHIVLLEEHPERMHSYHLFVIRNESRDIIRQRLMDRGIETGLHYPIPCHNQQAWISRFGECSLPATEKMASECLSLPIFPGMKIDEIDYVLDSIIDISS